MKKKLIILRFGSAMPTQKEHAIISLITGGTIEATGCSTPFGVLSIVNTTMTPAEVTLLFDKVARETDDALPTIVFDPEGPVGFSFHPEFFKHYEEANEAFELNHGTGLSYPKVITECTLSLDELLDLVKDKGLDHFTEAELTRLKELSK